MNRVAPSRRPSALQRRGQVGAAARRGWRRAAEGLDGRPGPVGRQLQRGRRAGQLLAPVGQLPVQRAGPRRQSRCQTA